MMTRMTTWSRLGRCVTGTMLCVLIALPPAAAGPDDNPGRGKPGVDFDEEMSPLQKQIERSHGEKKNTEMQKPQCQAAMQSGNQEDIDKFCKFPALRVKKFDQTECPTCGDIVNPNGKVVGKRIKTETVLDFANPGQRDEAMAKWDNVMLRKNTIGVIDSASTPDSPGSDRARLRRAVVFPDDASNEDKDCLDRITGERMGGLLDPSLPPAPDNLIPDGAAGSCFDAGGDLRVNLVEEAGGCRHESGAFIQGDPIDGVEDECYEEDGTFRGTSLEELIDEDGPEDIDNDNDGMTGEDPEGDSDGDGNVNDDGDCMDEDGNIFRDAACLDASGALLEGLAFLEDEDGPDRIDQDGDGGIDEDPPIADTGMACRNFGAGRGLKAGLGDMAGDECDLTRAVIVAANEKTMAEHGVKMFMADDDGNFDPTASGQVEFGQERRKVVLTETFTIECEEGAELVAGQCVTPPPAGAAGPGGAGEHSSGVSPMGANLSLSSMSQMPAAVMNGTLEDQVMMGFTVAPPAIKWGPKIEEFACADFPILGEVCVEIFFARLGYEFDAAVGLRLPMEIEVTEIPDPQAIAGDEVTLETTIQPLDFTAKQYRDFCIEHKLDDEPFISDCDRFSFPNFFSVLNPFTPESQIDGDEFVARLVVFAGLIVRVIGIPVITWGIDSATDLPTMCTMLNLKNLDIPLLNFGFDVAEDGDVIEAIKNQVSSCASFTTPFGKEPDPLTGIPTLRSFPINKTFEVRADCAEAFVRGETLTIKKKTRPICTNMVLGANGASLGIGLGLDVSAGSNLVEGNVSTLEDAALKSGGSSEPFEYRHSADEGEDPVAIGPIELDNYDPGIAKDMGRVRLDDFTYYLNTIQLGLKANLQFGGILSPFGKLLTVPIYNLIFDTGTFGIPFSQHAGTEPVEIPVFVENHALEVDLRPASEDPEVRVGPDTLAIRPGEFGGYAIGARNLGSVEDDVTNFRLDVSNRPDQTAPFVFGINRNTDFDCTDSAGAHFRGDPYNSVADDCFSASGEVRSDRTESIDEDPPGPEGAPLSVRDEDGDGLVDEDPADVWEVTPAAQALAMSSIEAVPPYAPATQTVSVAVSPFRHPLTAPGLYPVRVIADSEKAGVLGMNAVDPSGLSRLGASDVSFIEISSFYDPQVDVRPVAPSAPPGVGHAYDVTGVNFGNFEDSMTVQVEFVDFNQAGCNVATMGSQSGCPYRAFPTAIQPAEWTTAGGLAGSFGPLQPLELSSDGFEVLVPADWTGMEDTVYQFIVTVTSTDDPESPAAKNSFVVDQTVLATHETRTRFVGLGIDSLIAEIELAQEAGIQTGGLLPIQMYPAKKASDRALARIVAGNFSGAENALSSAIRIMEGFLHALDGFTGDGSPVPIEMVNDWRQRGEAIVGDLQTTLGEQVVPDATSETRMLDKTIGF